MEVLIFGEVVNNKIQEITYELVSAAKKLGYKRGDFVTVLPQADVIDVEGKVIVVKDINVNVVKKLFEKFKPKLVLFGNTTVSSDFASQLSASFASMPIATMVSEIRRYEDGFIVKSIVYGGKVIVECFVKTPAIVVINPGSYSGKEGRGESEVEELEVCADEKIKFLGYIVPEYEDVDISKEEVVVGVGRGIGDEANIEMAEELAKLLGGVIAGSRPVIDQGWLPKSRQVGRSGKTVTGKLYMALGISGATEHVEGVKAKNVIAVNLDREAPIFRISRYGVVADVNELIPVLVEKLKELGL